MKIIKCRNKWFGKHCIKNDKVKINRKVGEERMQHFLSQKFLFCILNTTNK